MGPVLNATGKQVEKSEQRDAKFKNAFLLLKTMNFTVINVNRYQLKSIKYSYISPKEAIETSNHPMCN